jgi:hypothetical protein
MAGVRLNFHSSPSRRPWQVVALDDGSAGLALDANDGV